MILKNHVFRPAGGYPWLDGKGQLGESVTVRGGSIARCKPTEVLVRRYTLLQAANAPAEGCQTITQSKYLSRNDPALSGARRWVIGAVLHRTNNVRFTV